MNLRPGPPASTAALVEAPYLLTTGYFEIDAEAHWPAHRHREHELLWADAGALRVRIGERLWSLSPGVALWIPAGTTHSASCDAGAAVGSTHVAERGVTRSWAEPTLVTVTPVVREMLLFDRGTAMIPERRLRTQSLCLELLDPVSDVHLAVPLPRDPRLAPLVAELTARPDDRRSLEQWAQILNLSSRTLSRLFAAELDTTFVQWRIGLRMRVALGRLQSGQSVGRVSRSVGYRNVSSFTLAF